MNAFYPKAMQAIIDNSNFRKIKHACSITFNILSVLVVLSLLILTVFWLSESPSVTKVIGTYEIINSKAGETTELKPSIQVSTESTRLVYTLILVNSAKEVVAIYPNRSVLGSPNLSDMKVTLPADLPSGNYSLIADMKYPRNPIRLNTLKVELARINVK